jgi:NAD(P)-dependent dehydrogenase (short-subunit alcohol dehydrogenase family)
MHEQRRVAVVTGANRGIGREIARQLAALGLTVILTARDLAAAEAVAGRVGAPGQSIIPRQLDVADQDSVDRFARTFRQEFDRMDALVNNAGAYYDTYQQAVNADLSVVEAALQVNLFGAWRMCQVAIPLMRRRGYGRIVNVSSGAGAFAEAGGGVPAYRTSKAALNMLTVTLAAELHGSGILVNAACPGWVRTDMGGPAAPKSVEEGADTPVWLATLPDDGPTGGFFRERRPIPW